MFQGEQKISDESCSLTITSFERMSGAIVVELFPPLLSLLPSAPVTEHSDLLVPDMYYVIQTSISQKNG